METGSAFVTGGSGFVGRNLIQHLIDLGNTTVTAIYRSDAAKQTIEGLVKGEAVSKVKLVQADLSQVDALQKGMEVSCRERGRRCSLSWFCSSSPVWESRHALSSCAGLRGGVSLCSQGGDVRAYAGF
jgi:NAD(P)-dependent dehydrogenase (short-subunit alcohol dehydrogenase family)